MSAAGGDAAHDDARHLMNEAVRSYYNNLLNTMSITTSPHTPCTPPHTSGCSCDETVSDESPLHQHQCDVQPATPPDEKPSQQDNAAVETAETPLTFLTRLRDWRHQPYTFHLKLVLLLILIVCILLAVAISICVAVMWPHPPTVTIAGIRVINTSLNQYSTPMRLNMTFLIDTTVYNPNSISSAYSTSSFPLYVNQIEAGTLVQPAGYSSAKSTSNVTVVGQINNLALPSVDQIAIWVSALDVESISATPIHATFVSMPISFKMTTVCRQTLSVALPSLTFQTLSSQCSSQIG